MDFYNDAVSDNHCGKRPICYLQPRFAQDEPNHGGGNRSRCAQTGTLLHVAAQQVQENGSGQEQTHIPHGGRRGFLSAGR